MIHMLKNYKNYIASNPATYPKDKTILVSAKDFTHIEGNYEIINNFNGVAESVLTDEVGSISLPVEIEEAGFYTIRVNYYAYEGKSSAIERRVFY